ncbi:Uncharacterised protein [BD1-7 clade bacterium]|uniref:Uncharacterized protein n=1 Tax=BD1-7 clade bacterium TaxID=2029982 RepID=A0A5S9MZQ5_9GAMM|nr:Uncharacterised protein [BD1-7 clade bacterium]CAA0085662.1 Uncharacterised protein [BD1-7 clade bacterium]
MANHFLGFGLGLRTDHFHDVLNNDHNIDWFEILSENYMVAGGKPLYYLEAIRERHPVVMHGVSLSLGSADPLNQDYLKQLKKLTRIARPQWFSDHLCWTGVHNTNTHDLMPLPYDMAVVRYVGDRIKQVQDHIGLPFLLENVSSYLNYQASTMTEWDFVNELVNYADCQLLLDVNNIYVSARNHDFDADDYLNAIDVDRVRQIHLAGHTDYGSHIIDTHDHDVCDDVWQLYARALKRFGAVSTMIERDANIPPFNELAAELDIARDIAHKTLSAEQLTPIVTEVA